MPDEWHSMLAAWLGTYLLHSTALLGGAWLAITCLRKLADEVKEIVWKSALVGGLVTASWQVGFSFSPLMGSLRMPGLSESKVAVSAFRPDTAAPDDQAMGGAQGFLEDIHRQWPALLPHAEQPAELNEPPRAGDPGLAVLPDEPGIDSPTAVDADSPQDTAAASGPLMASEVAADPDRGRSLAAWRDLANWRGALAMAAVVAGILALGLSIAGRGRLRARLYGRTEVTEGPMPALLLGLIRRTGLRKRVRLSCSDRIATPIAFGVLRWEICLPVRALADLDPHRQETLLAHELAHLVRRDPAWLAVFQVLETLLLIQPLNRLARRRFQELAELASDAWAVEQTGRHVSLAKCLTDVAAWMVNARHRPASEYVISMTSSQSALRRRVNRLLNTKHCRSSAKLRRWALLPAAITVGLAAVLLPGVTGAAGPNEPGRTEAPQAPHAEGVPLIEELASLDESISALADETEELRVLLRDLPADEELEELIGRLEEQLDRLGRRRDLLEAWIDFGLNDTDDGANTADDGPPARPADVHDDIIDY